MKRFYFLSLLLSFALAFVGCHKEVVSNEVTLKFNRTQFTLIVGDIYELSEEVVLEGSDKTPEFTSSNTAVATVDESGKLIAIASGETIITATVDDAKATCTIVVSDIAVDVIEILVDNPVAVGVEAEVKVKYTPSNYNPANLIWNCTSADANHTFTKKDETTYLFKFSEYRQGLSALVSVTDKVSKIQKSQVITAKQAVGANSIELSPSDIRVQAGAEPMTLSLTCRPIEYDVRFLEWASSNESVVKVDAGVLTFFNEGTADVTATDPISNISATCKVLVYTPSTSDVKARFITLDQTNVTKKVGDGPFQLKAECKDENQNLLENYTNLYWLSNDEAVATVDQNGFVSVVAPGTTTIRVSEMSSAAIYATCIVNVQPADVLVESVILTPSTYTMKDNETLELIATVSPSNATDKSLKFTSSDQAVAEVSANGLVTAKAVGKVTITALNEASGQKATSEITVVTSKVPVTAVELTASSLSLVVGKDYTLTATVKPDNATSPEVTWESDNTAVATVEGGKVTAIKEGKAIITAKADGVSATCEVTVQKIAVTEVKLNAYERSLSIGETFELSASVLPEDATYPQVSWTSSESSVAEVSDAGLVRAKSTGSATITATADGKSASCQIHVSEAVIEVSGITVSGDTELTIGETTKLTYTLSPEGASGVVNWSAAPASVASVSSEGLVEALSAGTVVITASCGSVSATHEITVKAPALESVAINPSSLSLDKTKTQQLELVITPSNAEVNSVSWSVTEGRDYVIVNTEGLLTAVAPGNAKVAVLVNGTKSATCDVTVNGIKPTGIQLSQSTLELYVNQTYSDLTYTITPSNCDYNEVTWSLAEASSAVSIDESTGEIKALAEGTATVRVTTKEGDYTDECVVTVVKPAATIGTIFINSKGNTNKIPEGQTLQLYASYRDTNEDNYTPITTEWESSNVNIATVNSKGLVTAVGDWVDRDIEFTITHKADGIQEYITLYLTQAVPTSVEITSYPTDYKMYYGSSFQFAAKVNPSNAEQAVKWSGTSETEASIISELSYDTGYFTPKSMGQYTITAKSAFTGYTHVASTITVQVLPIEIESASLNHSSLELLVGAEATLSVSFTPSNVTYKDVIWASTNTAVATVSDGHVSALSAGDATITATLSNGTVLSCPVTVNVDENAAKVGDFFYSDGTWSTTRDASKTVVGIVFSTNNATLDDTALAADYPEATHGLVLALDQTNGAFGTNTSESYMPCSENVSVMNGYSNTKQLLNHEKSAEFTVLNAMKSKSKVTGTSGWYIPSIYELGLVHENMAAVNASLKAVSGATQYADTSIRVRYWSSTAKGTSYQLAYCYRSGNVENPAQAGFWKSDSKVYSSTDFNSYTLTARYIFAF